MNSPVDERDIVFVSVDKFDSRPAERFIAGLNAPPVTPGAPSPDSSDRMLLERLIRHGRTSAHRQRKMMER